MNLNLWVFLSSISGKRLDVEFLVRKMHEIFEFRFVHFGVNGGMFAQLGHVEECWSDM